MEKLSGGKKPFGLYLSYGLILTALIFGFIHLLDFFLFNLTLISAIVNALFAILFGLLLGYIFQRSPPLSVPISCLLVSPTTPASAS
jgi:membrane protease YdiL (CAAX protease family)